MMIDLSVADSNNCAVEMYKHFSSESGSDEGAHGLIQSYADCNNFERKSRTKFKIEKEVEPIGRKRTQTFKQNSNVDVTIEKINESPAIENSLFECIFPKHLEGEFAAAIFEIGLKNSSPKVLMSLMPSYSTLTTEHIKSHLQKYRIHNDRSKEEFLEFYERYLRDSFLTFENDREWEKPIRKRKSLPNPVIDEELNLQKSLKLCPSSIIDTVENGVINWVGEFEKVISDHHIVIESLKCVANGEIPSRFIAEHTAAQQLESLSNAVPDDTLSHTSNTCYDNLIYPSHEFARQDDSERIITNTNTTNTTSKNHTAPQFYTTSNSQHQHDNSAMILTSESLNSSNRIRALASFYNNNSVSCSHMINNPIENIYSNSNYNNNNNYNNNGNNNSNNNIHAVSYDQYNKPSLQSLNSHSHAHQPHSNYQPFSNHSFQHQSGTSITYAATASSAGTTGTTPFRDHSSYALKEESCMYSCHIVFNN